MSTIIKHYRNSFLDIENESTRDTTPMVSISLKDYDKLKEKSKYITDNFLTTRSSGSKISI